MTFAHGWSSTLDFPPLDICPKSGSVKTLVKVASRALLHSHFYIADKSGQAAPKFVFLPIVGVKLYYTPPETGGSSRCHKEVVMINLRIKKLNCSRGFPMPPLHNMVHSFTAGVHDTIVQKCSYVAFL